MKLITKSLFVLSFLFLLTSCSKDEELLIEQQEVTTSADLIVEDVFAAQILDAVNEYRASIGKASFKLHTASKSKAIEHSKYMASKNEISHDHFYERSDYLKSQGAHRVSENVAFGYSNADEVLKAWLNSPSHREALEGDFTDSGIAVVKTEKGVTYFTQIFVN